MLFSPQGASPQSTRSDSASTSVDEGSRWFCIEHAIESEVGRTPSSNVSTNPRDDERVATRVGLPHRRPGRRWIFLVAKGAERCHPFCRASAQLLDRGRPKPVEFYLHRSSKLFHRKIFRRVVPSVAPTSRTSLVV